jgi:hypothetical protein
MLIFALPWMPQAMAEAPRPANTGLRESDHQFSGIRPQVATLCLAPDPNLALLLC